MIQISAAFLDQSIIYFALTIVIAIIVGYILFIKKRQQNYQKLTRTLPPLKAPFVSVEPILTGTLQLPESFRIKNGSPIKQDVTSLVYLIKHPQHGLLLFDGGLSKELSKANYGKLSKYKKFFNQWNIKIDRNYESTAKYIENTLNYNVADIKTMILSHFHWDHTGDVDDFKNAKLMMGSGINKIRSDVCITCVKKHRDYPYFGFELPIKQAIIEIEWDENSEAIGPFEKRYDVFNDGTVFVVDGDGHVPGHIMLVIKTKKHWILLAGDGAFASKNYNQNEPVPKGYYKGSSVDHDEQKGYETLCKIHTFYHMDNTIVCQAHFKMDEYEKIRQII